MPSLSKLAVYISRSIREQGLLATMRDAKDALSRRLVLRKMPAHPFDTCHGVDTGGLIASWSLKSDHQNRQHAYAYWGTQPSLFHAVLDGWERSLAGTNHSLESYGFIDIGCGKGRVMMMAATRPFRFVSGIDLDQRLVNIANQNLSHWTKDHADSPSISVECGDALTVSIPECPVAIYLYNPFADAVMQPFVEHLRKVAELRSAPIDILYVNSVYRDTMLAVAGMEVVWDAEVPMADEDYAIDPMQERITRSTVFRLRGLLSEDAVDRSKGVGDHAMATAVPDGSTYTG